MRRPGVPRGLLVALAVATAATTQPAQAAVVKDRTCAVTGAGDVTTNTEKSFNVNARGEVRTRNARDYRFRVEALATARTRYGFARDPLDGRR